MLTITFFVLTIYSILQANMALFHLETSRLLSLRILDTSTAATLFVTVVGALLLRRQFALSMLPRIVYKSTIATRQNPQCPSESYNVCDYEILNTGLGSAIINRVEYFIISKDADHSDHTYAFNGMVKELERIGLVHDRDFRAENITAGFTLLPKDSCPVFEIRTEHTMMPKHLMMVLYFQGQLGDKYRKEISLIQHS